MQNLQNYSFGCSEIAFKLGRYSYSKTANEEKIKRKIMIDDNTTSKTHYFRRSLHKIFDEETQEIKLQGGRPYEIGHYEYDFKSLENMYESNIPLLQSLFTNSESSEECKETIIKKIESICTLFSILPFQFRGASISIVISHKSENYDVKIIDLEYMYEHEIDGEIDETVEEG
mmetsp:Transcript_24945/g.22136  ORF Transcript_24945/g.22136 Transcript_24945/m.22136 type:complete len:173 (+) Transcript_24945:271-789(+)